MFSSLIRADFWEGDATKHFSLKKGFFREKGGGNSVNARFGKEFYRKGNSVKRSGPFSDPPESENLKVAVLIPFPKISSQVVVTNSTLRRVLSYYYVDWHAFRAGPLLGNRVRGMIARRHLKKCIVQSGVWALKFMCCNPPTAYTAPKREIRECHF